MSCLECDGCQKPTCDTGFYGNACNLTCNMNCRALPCSSCACEVCDMTSGLCSNGCDSGWYGTVCENVCPKNCFRERPFSVQCKQDGGTCLYGCTEGLYGDQCNETCSTQCMRSLCRQTNGECAQGCIPGFKGDFCDVEAGNIVTDEVAGAIGGAIVVALWGAIVVILICVIWRKRLKDYEVFNRNQSIGSHRTSSRRNMSRRSSNSSANGAEAQPMTDNPLYKYEICGNERQKEQDFRQSLVKMQDDTPPDGKNHAYTDVQEHVDTSNAFITKMPEGEYYVQFIDDTGRRQEFLVRPPSDEDLSESV